MRMCKTLWMACLILASKAQASEVRIRVTDLRSGEGYLALSVFSEAARDSYPGKAEGAVKTFYLKLDGRTAVDISINDLPDGRYAVAAMHDEDGDKKMKTALFGIPLEGFGFSKNPRVYIGPPSFEKARFDSSTEKEIALKIKYF